jgi:glutathione S-transferase
MIRGPFVMGEAYTICDPYLYTLVQWLEDDGCDATRYPRVIEHFRRVGARPATKAALAQQFA